MWLNQIPLLSDSINHDIAGIIWLLYSFDLPLHKRISSQCITTMLERDDSDSALRSNTIQLICNSQWLCNSWSEWKIQPNPGRGWIRWSFVGNMYPRDEGRNPIEPIHWKIEWIQKWLVWHWTLTINPWSVEATSNPWSLQPVGMPLFRHPVVSQSTRVSGTRQIALFLISKWIKS